MRRVELTEATEALSKYVRNVGKEPLLVVRSGKPVAALVPMTADQWEDYVVTHHAPLVESTRHSVDRFHAHGGSSIEDVMRRFGLAPKTVRRALRRPARATIRRTRG